MKQWMRRITVIPIDLYRWLVSPLLPSHCNYYPSCSRYTRDAILRHGILRGLGMGVLRIGRCSARHYGGNDPVPDEVNWRDLLAEYRRRSVKRQE